MSDESWLRAEFMTTEPQKVTPTLWSLGAGGVEVRDEETFFESPDWVPVPDGQTRLIAYFERAADATDTLRDELTHALGHMAHVDLVALAPYTDTSWKTAWRDYFHPRLLSPRVTVGPPWAELHPPEGGVTLMIDPGMAFGTGTHETTQLVATILDRALDAHLPASILDVGCGSAILSILAHKLGARGIIHGVDIDAAALENARDNLTLNDIPEGSITLATTPAADLPDTYELVVANILAHILLSLRDALLSRVAPGGSLILSGIIEPQVPDLLAAFDHPDFTARPIERRDEWFAITLDRNPAP